MVIGKVANQIDCFTIDHMNAIKDVPDGMLVSWEGRIEKDCKEPSYSTHFSQPLSSQTSA